MVFPFLLLFHFIMSPFCGDHRYSHLIDWLVGCIDTAYTTDWKLYVHFVLVVLLHFCDSNKIQSWSQKIFRTFFNNKAFIQFFLTRLQVNATHISKKEEPQLHKLLWKMGSKSVVNISQNISNNSKGQPATRSSQEKQWGGRACTDFRGHLGKYILLKFRNVFEIFTFNNFCHLFFQKFKPVSKVNLPG